MMAPFGAGQARPRISVVYVNYNTTSLLIDSLRSLEQHLSIDHEVIVVDNASVRVPLEASRILEIRPDAKIVMSDTNLGFGGGNNLGVGHASGEYLWILNTDTLLTERHNTERMVGWLDAHLTCGAVLPELLNGDGSHQDAQSGRFPTAARIVADKLHVPGALFYRHPLTSRDVQFASCAALLVRASAFAAVGGFSSEFFFFFEDTDLCKKLHEAGYSIRLCFESEVIHLRGASIADAAARKKIYYDALDIYAKKWFGPLGRRATLAMSEAMRRRWGVSDRRTAEKAGLT